MTSHYNVYDDLNIELPTKSEEEMNIIEQVLSADVSIFESAVNPMPIKKIGINAVLDKNLFIRFPSDLNIPFENARKTDQY